MWKIHLQAQHFWPFVICIRKWLNICQDPGSHNWKETICQEQGIHHNPHPHGIYTANLAKKLLQERNFQTEGELLESTILDVNRATPNSLPIVDRYHEGLSKKKKKKSPMAPSSPQPLWKLEDINQVFSILKWMISNLEFCTNPIN